MKNTKWIGEFEYKKDNQITMLILGFCTVIALITFGIMIGVQM